MHTFLCYNTKALGKLVFVSGYRCTQSNKERIHMIKASHAYPQSGMNTKNRENFQRKKDIAYTLQIQFNVLLIS